MSRYSHASSQAREQLFWWPIKTILSYQWPIKVQSSSGWCELISHQFSSGWRQQTFRLMTHQTLSIWHISLILVDGDHHSDLTWYILIRPDASGWISLTIHQEKSALMSVWIKLMAGQYWCCLIDQPDSAWWFIRANTWLTSGLIPTWQLNR